MLRSRALKNLICCLTLLITFFQINTAYPSSVHSITGQLSLLATIKNEPAFRPVIWKLKLNDSIKQKEMTISRHSAVIDLEAGNYQVTTIMGNTQKVNNITIKEGGKHKLVINLE